MTPENIIRALYETEALIPKGNTPAEAPYTATPWGQMGHCAWMIEQARGFVASGRTGKAQRWLGFVQGVLWARGIASVEQLKNVNRPPEREVEVVTK